MAELERRRVATEATLARYRSKEFDWGKGITCIHLARAHLRNLGHRPQTVPRFRSLLGAKKALAERGWNSIEDMFDSFLPRIAPAQMYLGDVALVPGEGLGAVFIEVGFGRLFGWHATSPQPVILGVELDEVTAAWRA